MKDMAIPKVKVRFFKDTILTAFHIHGMTRTNKTSCQTHVPVARFRIAARFFGRLVLMRRESLSLMHYDY